MRAVFDLDDTISVHKNRDYKNAEPINAVIDKMRSMKKDGWEIVIYSARGQISCNGDLEKIEKNNRDIVEEWLRKHDVPYDELLFGKPIGDIYIDDKGMSLGEFLESPFEKLHGGSGKMVYRRGNIVTKDFGTYEEKEAYRQWTESNNGEFLFPKVYSYVYNTLYMEYVSGERGCDVDAVFVPSVVDQIIRCKETRKQAFDIELHVERLKKNYTGNKEADKLIDRVAQYLQNNKERLNQEGSYCHGDLTLSNMIINGGNVITVDARNTVGANSYLLDFAKLRMSLNGYEKIAEISDVDNSKWVEYLDGVTKDKGCFLDVLVLEIMFIFRCYRYISPDKKDRIIQYAIKESQKWL